MMAFRTIGAGVRPNGQDARSKIPLGTLSAVLQVIAAFFVPKMIYLALFLFILICLVLAECIFQRTDVVRAYPLKSNSVDDGIPDYGKVGIPAKVIGIPG
jgi:hypothetical protein